MFVIPGIVQELILWITFVALIIMFHKNQLPGRVGNRISCYNNTPTSGYDDTPHTSVKAINVSP